MYPVLLAVTAVGVPATDEDRRTSSEQYRSHSPVTVIRDRIKLHCYKHVAFFEGIKECRGYTVLFLLVIKGKKSVGYTVCLHHNDGRKECGVHCLSPSLMEEKSVGYTVCLHL